MNANTGFPTRGGEFGVWDYFWGIYIATFGAKSDVIFFLDDPDFLYKGDEISRLSRLVFEI